MNDSAASGQVVKGLLDTLVLYILKDADNYGRGILEALDERIGSDSSVVKQATLYPLLHRLERKGFVDAYFEPGARGTQRKYYRLTSKGLNRLEQRRAEWLQVSSILARTILMETTTEGSEL